MVVDSKKAIALAKQIFRGVHPQGELVSGFTIKAVAMDLDGTLLHSDRTLYAHTAATIKRVSELGILCPLSLQEEALERNRRSCGDMLIPRSRQGDRLTITRSSDPAWVGIGRFSPGGAGSF